MCTADVVLCKHCVTSAVYKSATALSLLQKSCLYYVLSASVLDLTIYFRSRLTYFHIALYSKERRTNLKPPKIGLRS